MKKLRGKKPLLRVFYTYSLSKKAGARREQERKDVVEARRVTNIVAAEADGGCCREVDMVAGRVTTTEERVTTRSRCPQNCALCSLGFLDSDEKEGDHKGRRQGVGGPRGHLYNLNPIS
jgi:hypothetical protein